MRVLVQKTAALKQELIIWGVKQCNQINAKTLFQTMQCFTGQVIPAEKVRIIGYIHAAQTSY